MGNYYLKVINDPGNIVLIYVDNMLPSRYPKFILLETIFL